MTLQVSGIMCKRIVGFGWGAKPPIFFDVSLRVHWQAFDALPGREREDLF